MSTRISERSLSRDPAQRSGRRGPVAIGAGLLCVILVWSAIRLGAFTVRTPFTPADALVAQLVLMVAVVLILAVVALYWRGVRGARIALIPAALLGALANSNVEMSTVVDGMQVSSQSVTGRILGLVGAGVLIVAALRAATPGRAVRHHR